jgi:hypothetical protein
VSSALNCHGNACSDPTRRTSLGALSAPAPYDLPLGSGHSFHTACVEPWFRSKSYQRRTCPVCRQNPLVSDEEFALMEREDEQERLQGQDTNPIVSVHSFFPDGEWRTHARTLSAAWSMVDAPHVAPHTLMV